MIYHSSTTRAAGTPPDHVSIHPQPLRRVAIPGVAALVCIPGDSAAVGLADFYFLASLIRPVEFVAWRDLRYDDSWKFILSPLPANSAHLRWGNSIYPPENARKMKGVGVAGGGGGGGY